MSETLAAEPGVVVGRLEEVRDDGVVLSVPDTDYRLHLVTSERVAGAVKDRVSGRVSARARRVDVVPSGGRYVEPVFGRPRRIQGRIIGGDVSSNTIMVDAAVPVVVTLMSPQRTGDFSTGQLVSFDVESGATFEPM